MKYAICFIVTLLLTWCVYADYTANVKTVNEALAGIVPGGKLGISSRDGALNAATDVLQWPKDKIKAYDAEYLISIREALFVSEFFTRAVANCLRQQSEYVGAFGIITTKSAKQGMVKIRTPIKDRSKELDHKFQQCMEKLQILSDTKPIKDSQESKKVFEFVTNWRGKLKLKEKK